MDNKLKRSSPKKNQFPYATETKADYYALKTALKTSIKKKHSPLINSSTKCQYKS
jgi:hypothetical protein